MSRQIRVPQMFAACGLMVSAALLSPGCNSTTASRSKPISQVAERQPTPRSASTRAQATEQTPRSGSLYGAISESEISGEYALRDTMAALGEHVAEYTQHVMTLSSPFFKGRSADSPGGELAGDYIQEYFEDLGLEPAFPKETLDEDYELVAADGDQRSFRQPFSVSGGVHVSASETTIIKGDDRWALISEEDFAVLGFSGTQDVTGELAFIGYAIEDGPDGYSSFGQDDDLTGKIAMFLRFEPMDATGKSLWSDRGRWSANAGLMTKVNAAVDRGAAAVILVNPPGADDPRVADLPTSRTTRFGRPADVPVISMSIDAAKDLVEMADPNGRSLFDLRRAADRGEIDSAYTMNKDGLQLQINAGLEKMRLLATNVGAVLPGKGALADEWVVIGAHYDHVGFGFLGGANPSNAGELHPGADDNASGTVGLLLGAKVLAERYAQMNNSDDARSILFLAFAAEEMGLLGSRAYVERMEIAPSQVNAMLNMDMIGRLTNNELTLYGIGTSDDFTEGGVLDHSLNNSGLAINRIEQGGNRSDHANFIREGIPSIHYFTGSHADYHRPGDIAALVNYGGGMRVTELVIETAYDLATMDGRIEFKEQPTQQVRRGPSRMSMSVRLGISPGNYDADANGVAIDEVFEDTTAALGGLEKGDVIIKWNGEEMGGVRGMMTHLGSHKPGDKVDIVVLREGKEVDIQLTMKAREGAR